MKTKIGIGLTVLAMIAGALFISSNVLAFNQTLYVGHGMIGNDKSCTSPGYSSVQSAVTAAQNGDTVYLCGATFAEQVFINNKSITLTGDSSSGLTPPATFATVLGYPSVFKTDNLVVPQALLVLTGNSNTTVKGLTFNGPMPGSGDCGGQEYGILSLGGNVNLYNDNVTNIADQNTALYGCQFGVAVEIGAGTWPANDGSYPTTNFTATADIEGGNVTGYQKNGITADGPGTYLNVNGTTVVGGDPYSAFGVIVGQNGIQISDGASGDVQNSIITNNAYTGNGYAFATAVLVYGGYDGSPLSTKVKVDNNKLIDNDVAVAFDDYNNAGTGGSTTKTDNEASNNWIFSGQVTNVSGLCGGSTDCGGKLIGYQAGIQDIGNSDSACSNTIAGPGYQNQGEYNYSATSAVFTQTGPNQVFVRQIDAGDTFPTINFTSCDQNQYHSGGYYYGHHNNGFRF